MLLRLDQQVGPQGEHGHHHTHVVERRVRDVVLLQSEQTERACTCKQTCEWLGGPPDVVAVLALIGPCADPRGVHIF